METIRFDYLKTFLTVSRTRSFSVAAKELKTSQGTVSHQIAALEEAFNAELFKRTANGVELTSAGEILQKTAEKILGEVDQARVGISLTKQEMIGTIQMNVSTIPGEHVIPHLIAEFQKKHPEVKFSIKAEDSINSILNVLAGKVDFAAVGTIKGYSEKLQAIQIGQEELVLIVPTNHELSNGKSVNLGEIVKFSYVNREENSGTRKEVEHMLENSAIPTSKLKIQLELASTESVITAVSEGQGISIISSIAAKKAQAAGLIKVLHIKDTNSTRKLYMVRSKKPLIKISEAFWEFCKNKPYKTIDSA